MKNLLHIIATPRGDDSRTLKVSREFLDILKDQWKVETLNLFEAKLPDLTLKRVTGKYILLSGKELDKETQDAWGGIVKYIEQFTHADGYLISTPMWNFSIPYILKHYIDVIVQPKYMFRYTATGPQGLVTGKKMTVISSRGGDYSSEAVRHMDLLVPYLRTVFGMVGIEDIDFINVEPMDAQGEDVRDRKINEVIEKIKMRFL
ncbi:MAG: NAD(P)H-dependent oxidoreductase [Candidatus Omnitrophota bacterium]|jgi:FMN-dependent NADH-azoreductase